MESNTRQGIYESLKNAYKLALLDLELTEPGTQEYLDAQRRAANASNTCAVVIGCREAEQLRKDNIEAVNRIMKRQTKGDLT